MATQRILAGAPERTEWHPRAGASSTALSAESIYDARRSLAGGPNSTIGAKVSARVVGVLRRRGRRVSERAGRPAGREEAAARTWDGGWTPGRGGGSS